MNTGIITTETNKKQIKASKKEIESIKEKMRAYEEEMVEITFYNLENPRSHNSLGGVKFAYKKWDGPNINYELFDGETYTLPRGVVNHLNNDCYTKVYKEIDNKYGMKSDRSVSQAIVNNQPMLEIRKVPRFRCERKDRNDDFRVDLSLVETV